MNDFVEVARVELLGGVAEIEAIFGMAIGFGMLVVVPLTAMLLAHQRRMAELINQKRTEEGLLDRIEQLERTTARLTDRVNDITLAIDDSVRARLQPPDRLET